MPDKPKPEKFTIHIDKQVVHVSSATLTGAEIRALHDPPIAEDRDLYLEGHGGGDDTPIGDTQPVSMTNGMHFFSAPRSITPGT
jgi:hypothetical protein